MLLRGKREREPGGGAADARANNDDDKFRFISFGVQEFRILHVSIVLLLSP